MILVAGNYHKCKSGKLVSADTIITDSLIAIFYDIVNSVEKKKGAEVHLVFCSLKMYMKENKFNVDKTMRAS